MSDRQSILQFNKFADLHDGKKIIFCKTDFILQEFNKIKNLNNDVILITGNSDFSIFFKNNSFIIKDLNHNILTVFKQDLFPKNIKLWFAVNNCTDLNFIKTLPLGIENDIDCKLIGHGKGWPHAIEKVQILSEEFSKPDFNLIKNNFYFNNNINTNLQHRLPIRDYLIDKNVDVENDTLSFKQFILKCKSSKAVICPAGNGLDTHKFYETLMMRRIPIILKVDNYSIYSNFYNKFPCIILNNIEELFSEKTLDDINKYLYNFDDKLLKIDYWKQYILDSVKLNL